MSSDPKATVVIRAPRGAAEKLRRVARETGISRPAFLQLVATRYADEIRDRELRRLRPPAEAPPKCGAPKGDGSPCGRRVKGAGDRCWQHAPRW
jgi:hypothetical protein